MHRRFRRGGLLLLGLALVAACRSAPAPSASAAPAPLERRVRVRPVLLVPRDVAPPSPEPAELLLRQLAWARERYRELLLARDSFELAPGGVLLLEGARSVAEYEASADGGAQASLLELFAHDGVDRASCDSIYLVLFVGTGHWPGGGARPINGGVNTGGGIVVLAADDLAAPNFQSTLQHELGHAFGLPHVDVYGYDMSSNPSLMSYNPAHHTRGFEPSATPGALIPEDLRALHAASRVFPRFAAGPLPAVPAGYSLAPMVFLGPMTLAGQADYAGPAIGT